MINIIVFSNNSAARLDLLLRSMDTFWKTHPMINVIFESADGAYHDAYKKLELSYLMEPVCMHRKTKNLHSQIEEILNASDFDYVMFLSDTNIFTHPFNVDCVGSLYRRDVLAFNPILGGNINCCPTNEYNEIPYIIYNWKNYPNTDVWGTPINFNGSILRSSFVKAALKDKIFETKVEMLALLYQHEHSKNYVAIYKNSCIVDNCFGDDKELNNTFLENKQIDLKPFLFFETSQSCINYPHNIVWKN